jgi:uncharacterized RDD family membrane protein YckC
MNSSVAHILFCTKCGSPTAAHAQFCNNCGTPLPAASAIAAVPVYTARYGGFWIRLLAFIIDATIVKVASWPLFFLTMRQGITEIIRNHSGEPDPATIMALVSGGAMFLLSTFTLGWLYEAFMLSSDRQATLGKMALGLKVTDLNGQPISFGRATGRHFAKFLSGLVACIGFIIAAFTERKQALHDMLASTLVVKE